MEASRIPMAAPSPPSPPPRALDEPQGRIQERLRLTAALADPAAIARHLERMPARYLVDVDVDADDKAEDVLLHWRILDECADPKKRPVFHARHVKGVTIPAVYDGSDGTVRCQKLMNGLSLEKENTVGYKDSRTTTRVIPIHEIIFCSLDRPKLLCQLSSLFDEVGLHIREGHLYCTLDGYCLAIFLVDGWKTQETDGLLAEIIRVVERKVAQQSNST